MNRELQQFLQAGASGDLLPWQAQVSAAVQFSISFTQVEEAALMMGLLPARYQRNRQAISVKDQLKLFRSWVAVIGCGGLGGYVIEELARVGVGTIIAIDPDVFEEHNLNRQLLSSPGELGRAKVQVAAARVGEVNPAVTLVPVQAAYSLDNGKQLLREARMVVDALDSIPTRLALAETCAELGVPLVHGAIAGWYGQVTTQFPGEDTIQKLYGRWSAGKGAEQRLGNPSFTPALVASIQAAEVCKVLLGVGETLRGRKLSINLLDMSFEEIAFEPTFAADAAGRADPVASALQRINRVNKMVAIKKKKPSATGVQGHEGWTSVRSSFASRAVAIAGPSPAAADSPSPANGSGCGRRSGLPTFAPQPGFPAGLPGFPG